MSLDRSNQGALGKVRPYIFKSATHNCFVAALAFAIDRAGHDGMSLFGGLVRPILKNMASCGGIGHYVDSYVNEILGVPTPRGLWRRERLLDPDDVEKLLKDDAAVLMSLKFGDLLYRKDLASGERVVDPAHVVFLERQGTDRVLLRDLRRTSSGSIIEADLRDPSLCPLLNFPSDVAIYDLNAALELLDRQGPASINARKRAYFMTVCEQLRATSDRIRGGMRQQLDLGCDDALIAFNPFLVTLECRRMALKDASMWRGQSKQLEMNENLAQEVGGLALSLGRLIHSATQTRSDNLSRVMVSIERLISMEEDLVNYLASIQSA